MPPTIQKKILILGGTHSDIPIIRAAKSLGYYVITSGNNPNDIGHKHADMYHCADYSDPEAILSLSKELNITAICPASNDFSALSASYTAEHLGLNGHDSYITSKIIHHKDLYREFALKNNIATPFAKGFSCYDMALSFITNIKIFPLIIKPIDLSGGKGITVIHNIQEAEKALTKAFAQSKASKLVIEEFIDGSYHGASFFLNQNKVTFSFFDNEFYYKNPFLVSATSTPAIISQENQDEVINTAEQISRLLKLKTGIFHVQYIIANNRPIITEICRRTPGDLYVRWVELAANINYSSWIVRAFSGENSNYVTTSKPQGFHARHCIMSAKTGIVSDITYSPKIRGNIIEKFIWGKKGDTITNALSQKLGIVFLKFDSLNEMQDKTHNMQDLIRVSIR